MSSRCKQSFVTHDKQGNKRIVHRGEMVDSNDAIKKGREAYFDDIESATQAPGEKRYTKRPKKSTEIKSDDDDSDSADA